jgi:putative FmdB family regulatory protein
MPRYDFECSECKTTFEVDLKISEKDQDSDKKVCPKCQSKKVQQIISFKGGISTGGSSAAAPSCPTGTCPFAK